MSLHVRVYKSQKNTHMDPTAVNRKHMYVHRKSGCVLGRISVCEIQKNRAGVDTDTSAGHNFKNIIWEDSKVDLSQRLICAN